MTRKILPGDPPVEITLLRSAQARRFSLRVSRLDGRVTLSMPRFAPEAEALGFARDKADWIRKAQAARPVAVAVGSGTVLPVAGQEVTVQRAAVLAVTLAEGRLLVPEITRNVGPAVLAFLRAEAQRRLHLAAATYAQRLGVSFHSLALRDTRSRWGSCTTAGRLMFSWRLILTPQDVLNYVAAHEVAHLAVMDHSQHYWATVEKIFPDWQLQRQWLRRNGTMVHGFRFD